MYRIKLNANNDVCGINISEPGEIHYDSVNIIFKLGIACYKIPIMVCKIKVCF